MSGWIRTTFALVLLLAGACQQESPQAPFEDYLGRVARLTERQVQVAEPQPGPRYPPRRALELDIPRRTINVAEFFDLHGCDMGALVGYRNSPLGRVQQASQRLGYETAWLAGAEACGAEAAGWLAEVRMEKRQRLPALFWNATFAAAEMRTALGGAAAPAQGNLADLVRGLNDSYDRVLEGNFDLGEFERRLGRLQQESWLGPARRGWSRWRRYLDAAADALDQAAPDMCLNGRPTPRARRLQTVFRKFYVGDIQPLLAETMRRHEAWITELARLLGRLEAVRPPAFDAWYERVLSPAHADSEWRRTQRAVVAHAEAWQRLFARCAIDPAAGLRQD